MANVPATSTANVPAHIAARIAARQQGGAKSTILGAVVGDGLSFPRVSIRAGRYRLVENGVETPVGISLDVVIVGANPKVSKIFYAQAYDGNAAGVRPACFSHDGVAPDASVSEPVHSNCATCPNNVLGSKILPSGAKSKLCADQRHLAVVAAADPNKVYGITIPVSGMKALREYFKDLQNFGIEPQEVVTELGFDDQASFPQMVFKRKGFVPESALPKVDALLDTDEVREVVRLLPPKNRVAISAPAQQAALAVAAPAAPAAPVVDEAYDDVPPPAPAQAAAPTKPTVAPVKGSEALEKKLDDLFG